MCYRKRLPRCGATFWTASFTHSQSYAHWLSCVCVCVQTVCTVCRAVYIPFWNRQSAPQSTATRPQQVKRASAIHLRPYFPNQFTILRNWCLMFTLFWQQQQHHHLQHSQHQHLINASSLPLIDFALYDSRWSFLRLVSHTKLDTLPKR